MKTREIKNKYRLVSGDTIVAEATSLPKLAKSIGCHLSCFYNFKPKNEDEQWNLHYKGFEYTIEKLV